jgi:hypothetical protein
MFKGETPKLKDPAIKTMIEKYPPPPNIQKLIDKLTKVAENPNIVLIEQEGDTKNS